MLYLVRRNLSWGLLPSFHYHYTRPSILRSAPVEETTDGSCEIHILTSEEDCLNALWTLKTFYFFSRRQYRLVIHSDGTLTKNTISHLEHHFPKARLIDKEQADHAIEGLLEAHPRCLAIRREHFISAKEFDFPAFASSDRLLFLDSDVIFFCAPTELLRRIEDPEYRLNTVNPDIETCYSMTTPQLSKAIGCRVPERFNSGVGLIFRESLNWGWIEEFLSIPGILDHPWRFEQTLAALCSARWGVELLPGNYRVHLGSLCGDEPLRHYVGKIRHLMYGEGMPRALSWGLA